MTTTKKKGVKPIYVNEALHKRIKTTATQKGISITKFIEGVFTEAMAR